MFEEKMVAPNPTDINNSVNEDSVATTKEEEWVTKKKTDIITTRQIETRVKRQLVVEDGKIVQDSGPLVTTNTTEDTEKQEHSQTEHRNLGEDNSTEKWTEVSNPKGCIKEVEEKTVRSRQETEERIETENVKHLGDISDEGYMTVIKSGSDDFRQALEVSNKKGFMEISPKIIHQSQKIKKYIDKEDKLEQSSLQPGGKIINETKTILLHEEFGDYNISDDDDLNNSQLCEKTKKENFQRYRKIKEQDITEYLADGQKIGEKLHYQAENSEGERLGDFFDDHDNISIISSKLKRIKLRARNHGSELKDEGNFFKHCPAQNLENIDPEEEAKKAETSKWLEHHFGSESTKSSSGSFEDFEDIIPSTQNSFISVTMKSQPLQKNRTSQRFPTSFDEDGTNNFKFSRSNDHGHRISEKYERKDDDYSASVFDSKSSQNISNYENNFQNSKESSTIFSSSPMTINEVNFSQTQKVEPYQKFQTICNSQKTERVPTTDIKIHNFPNKTTTYSNKKQAYSTYYHCLEGNTKHENQSSFQSEIRPSNCKKNISKVNSSSMEFLKSKEQSLKSKTDGLRTPRIRDNTITTFDLLPKKKMYQRTRFAADIPHSPQQNHTSVKQKNKIGESFRKLIGKLRPSPDTKYKKRLINRGSRSPSPNENTYENYNSLDNYESLMSKTEKETHQPMAPLRTKCSNINSHSLEKQEKLVQRYYLGEDPFTSSIYGKEKEYEQNQEKNQKIWEPKGGKSEVIKDFKTRTLGRFSKSTSGLINAEKFPQNNLYNRGGIKTLPRKFLDETEIKPVTVLNTNNDTCSDGSYQQERNKIYHTKAGPIYQTNSMINVSFVNKPQESPLQNKKVKYVTNELCGPAKPARTYRSKLSRSQSFNIQPGENSFVELYKSNPHFQSLEESPPPLKSPSIISEWSQNSDNYKEKRIQISDPTNKGNLFTKDFNILTPELNKIHYNRDYNSPNNANTTFQNEMTLKRKFVNYSSSFRSESSINTKDSNSDGEDQQRYSKVNYNIPLKFPISIKSLHHNETNKTLSRNEDTGIEYATVVKNKSGYQLSETFPEEIPSSKKLIAEPAEWKNFRKLVKGQITNDERKFCNINNSKGIVIKVLNSKN